MPHKNLFKVAGLIALITIFSKIVGFARDVITAHAYGATTVSDAYFYAYQIPALALILLGGLGGPFHTATIAVFSKEIDDTNSKPSRNNQSLLNSYITLTSIVFLILTVLAFFFSDLIINAIAANGTPELHHLASLQLKIMAPVMFIGGLVGILYGISNVYNEFLFTSLSPTIASVAVIIAILLFGKHDNYGVALAWGTLIGAVGQILLQLPVFFRSGFRYKPEFNFYTEKISKLGEILFPAMISTTIGQINIYVDMFFASKLPPGSWSAIGYANRIFQFPVGIIITALLVPLFPMFSTFVSKKEWISLRHYFHEGLMSLWYMAFPILAFIIIFSQDTIRLLLQRGHFTAHDTKMVAIALIFLTLSIVPYVARDTLTRIFYAFDDSKTPFYIAMFSIIVKASMNMLFINHLGIGAITLSTSAVTLINGLLLAVLIRKKINLDYKKLINPVTKIFAVTLIMSAVAYGAKLFLDHVLPDTTGILALKLMSYSIISIVVYCGLSLTFKIKTAEKILEKCKSFISKKIKKEELAVSEQ